ncbi:MAG: hypothetical protein KJ904_17300 [Alphaproteobacteria bacterium]|nr:hypothetical protein [Alphaproteobacteria bacterium]MBU0797298.1 hypothetical protein [Alphaproteobacteria bacterium]MBU0888914.1 hypothetical protein [Alphaproteobacteria bacterium]MBU1813934.1 hypothetical protein [Alphaproteobacteria bacterium]
MAIQVPVSWGELMDKISILEIKSERIDDAAKLVNVRAELTALAGVRGANLPADRPTLDALDRLMADIKAVNEALWEIEDDIRDCERARDFGDRFVALARAVYKTNDKRAELKREINTLLGSALVEEKSYKPYE